MRYTLQGIWTADIGDGNAYPMQLPGTLDENKIGHKDQGLNQWHPDAELGTGNEYFPVCFFPETERTHVMKTSCILKRNVA